MSSAVDNLRPRRRRAKAFTLVELLLGMLLLVMIMVAVALAMQGAASASKYGLDKARSLQQASLTLRRLSADIRRAQNIQLTQPGCLDLVMPDSQWRRYRWNCVVGQPLEFRSDFNPLGNTLIADVAEFTVEVVNEWSDVQQAVVPMYVRVVIEARHDTASTRLETMVRPRRNIL